jgi:LacI family transcriptional regulator
VTIHDVAARAGVSVATVSRVLNGKSLVREETSRAVLAVASALRYVPNVAARALSIRRSHAVGIVLPDVHGEFFSEVIRGIDVAARHSGYHILVSGSHSNANETLEVLEAMRGRVDGLIVMAPDVSPEQLRDQLAPDQPLVLLNSNDGDHDAVAIDNAAGARLMMEHLIALGHSRIAFIRGPAHNIDARERLRGYRLAIRRLHGSTTAAIECPGDFTEQSGHEATLRLLQSKERPTAIFAANDSMAVGALAALAESGVTVPGEMAVAGFDDIPIARYVSPPLTTISIDISGLGRRAFALLLDAIAQTRTGEARRERAEVALVVRASSGAPLRQLKTSKQPATKLRGRTKGEK